jgi:23S rRNA pseudouridine955/2504/2580 synthase
MKEIMITTNEAGQRLDKFLRKYLADMSLSAIYKAIRTKQVTVNGKKGSEKYSLNEGDILRFNFEIENVKKQKKLDFLNIEYDFKTIYEDDNIIVVEKKPGVLVHPDEGGEITLTEEVMSYLYDKGQYKPDEEKTFSPSPCNRLDRNTEGLVVFAKNYDSLKIVNECIKNGDVKKFYTTIVKGKISDGVYNAFILKEERKNKVKIYEDKVAGSKEIITDIKTVETIGTYSQLDIDLVTGRSHQIRAHLSHKGNPIVGDSKYGDRKINSFFMNKYGINTQLLIAYKVVFAKTYGSLKYLEGKTIVMPLPPIFKKIKNDLFKF